MQFLLLKIDTCLFFSQIVLRRLLHSLPTRTGMARHNNMAATGQVVAILTCVWLRFMPVAATAVKGKLHTFPEHLRDVIGFEKLVVDAIGSLPESEEASLYLQSHEWAVTDTEAAADSDEPDEVIYGNPLHVYALIKRMVLYWKPLRKTLLGSPFHTEAMAKVQEAEKTLILPTDEDLVGAAQTIGLLQHVYLLQISHLQQGLILNVSSSVRLDIWDCIRVAQGNEALGRLSASYLWYRHALSLASNVDMSAHVSALMESVRVKHDTTFKNSSDLYFLEKLAKVPDQELRSSSYSLICRGSDEGGRTSQAGPPPCHVTTRGSPYFLLQPLRVEVISGDPEIILFYNFLSDNEVKVLLQLSQDKMQQDDHPSRQSHHMLLPNSTHPVVESLSRRVAYVTHLHQYEGTDHTNTAGEQLKVRYYGTGGHLKPHVDTYFRHSNDTNNPLRTPMNLKIGDRLASLVFYLNDVQAGGATAFYNLKLLVKPQKGSALFWHNLKRNGEYDRRLDHGGCPIILGKKWLAIKWIREHLNFLRRPCTTDPEA
ncbi:prolyl 4-hydroxylase subunit alpha-3-like [Penaeus japonicus]|uniref:prolyl 4-hydroxylase subunit alpha-3-like n=1 Tax=Penaeus japonicus TaxID=27405 RepID=UPI001C7144DF|nr:prolyl 4-hydroxylase subunit alpha-3-like [Penaeus japonicus]